MRNLFRFISRYRSFLFFILLQVIAFVLLFRANSYHNAVLFHSADHWIGSLYEFRSDLSSYFQLKEENEVLVGENERLRRQLLEYEEDPDIRIEEDSSFRERYELVPARVINSTLHRRNNHLTIDQGKEDGVHPDMGVIGPNGIVGVVRNVSSHFATVLPILNANFYASVKLYRTNDFGLLEWPGSSPTRARMVDVAQHVKVKEGDSVVTRGASAIFPPGVPVGIVSSVKTDPSRNYHELEVELSTDFSKLYHVYVIRDRLKKEKEELEKELEDVR